MQEQECINKLARKPDGQFYDEKNRLMEYFLKGKQSFFEVTDSQIELANYIRDIALLNNFDVCVYDVQIDKDIFDEEILENLSVDIVIYINFSFVTKEELNMFRAIAQHKDDIGFVMIDKNIDKMNKIFYTHESPLLQFARNLTNKY